MTKKSQKISKSNSKVSLFSKKQKTFHKIDNRDHYSNIKSKLDWTNWFDNVLDVN